MEGSGHRRFFDELFFVGGHAHPAGIVGEEAGGGRELHAIRRSRFSGPKVVTYYVIYVPYLCTFTCDGFWCMRILCYACISMRCFAGQITEMLQRGRFANFLDDSANYEVNGWTCTQSFDVYTLSTYSGVTLIISKFCCYGGRPDIANFFFFWISTRNSKKFPTGPK